MNANRTNLFRKAGLLLAAVMLMAGLFVPTQSARALVGATIVVNSTSDADNAADGVCTLREAIQASINDANYHECTGTGYGSDTIVFSMSGSPVIMLTSNLPAISSGNLTINGSNTGSPVVIDGAGAYRPFYVSGSAALTLRYLTVQHGYSADIGGAVVAWGDLSVYSSSFLNNTSVSEGGAIETTQSSTTLVVNSTFSGNSSGYGGAISNNTGTLTLLNSTLSGNTATSDGGAVSIYDGSGIADPVTTISNTIMANSIGPTDCMNWSQVYPSGGNNIIEKSAAVGYGCDLITASTADPKLGALTGSPVYFPLNLGSPAIDAGDDAICAAASVNNESQNAVTRPRGVHCDIGSYELPIPLLITPADTVILPTNRPSFDWTEYPGAAQYQIQVATNPGFKPVAINKMVKLNSFYLPTKNLLSGTLYYWHVRAKTSKGWTPWSDVFTFTTGNPPSVPVLVAPPNKKVQTTTAPVFSWKASQPPAIGTLAGYYIQVASDKAFTLNLQSASPAGPTYNGFTLTSGTYYWRVRSVAGNGDYSAWALVRIVSIQ